MRSTIRSYVCGFFLVMALAVPLSADTTTGDEATGFLAQLTNAIIVVFDAALKVGMPPG